MPPLAWASPPLPDVGRAPPRGKQAKRAIYPESPLGVGESSAVVVVSGPRSGRTGEQYCIHSHPSARTCGMLWVSPEERFAKIPNTSTTTVSIQRTRTRKVRFGESETRAREHPRLRGFRSAHPLPALSQHILFISLHLHPSPSPSPSPLPTHSQHSSPPPLNLPPPSASCASHIHIHTYTYRNEAEETKKEGR